MFMNYVVHDKNPCLENIEPPSGLFMRHYVPCFVYFQTILYLLFFFFLVMGSLPHILFPLNLLQRLLFRAVNALSDHQVNFLSDFHKVLSLLWQELTSTLGLFILQSKLVPNLQYWSWITTPQGFSTQMQYFQPQVSSEAVFPH